MRLGVLGAAGLSFAVLVIVFVPLERLFPARRGQRVLRPAFFTDACFFFGQYLVFNLLSIALLSALSSRLPARAVGVAGAIGAVLAGDLLVYFFHRACHRYAFLWRFHAVHHSSEHLDWLAAHREHPVDGLLTQLCQNLPAMLLGVPPAALAALAVFRGMWAIFVHSNVRLPLGPLRWLFGAPELHHWHHARLPRTTHNFANLAPWIDWLFGTHHLPDGEESYALGLVEPFPKSYLMQLLAPFRGSASSRRRGTPRTIPAAGAARARRTRGTRPPRRLPLRRPRRSRAPASRGCHPDTR
jgi:sterol desaturase/sphingolipid hydroxylase (fatty acid hydroxylase superfamily)